MRRPRIFEPSLRPPERRPLVDRPGVLIVTPRLDSVDGVAHEALPADAVHPCDRDRHTAHAFPFHVHFPAGLVDCVDLQTTHVSVLGMALAVLLSGYEGFQD